MSDRSFAAPGGSLSLSRLSPLPELLAPAGSPEALEAALHAGADAVYLGGSSFNARLNAHNFDRTELAAAVTAAHAVGARVYLTLNTLVYDRERATALDAAYDAAVCGVDGLIIADVGMAALIHRALPNLPLHASTQLSGHSYRVGEFLKPRGFSRYVTARESSLDDLRCAVAHSGLEVEVFIHGALCVSHSGQCLFSSIVGGRSGNRGECAQPCRLPYSGCRGCVSSGKSAGRPNDRREHAYPLSLKDLSLARHLPALIDAGVASLKIEGRMKSPAYVGGVTAIWRHLLDERRGATDEEMVLLSDLFSRGGFTDGYLTSVISHSMMGVRSDEDKTRTHQAEKSSHTNINKFGCLPIDMTVTLAPDTPIKLTVSSPRHRQGDTPADTVAVTVEGDTPDVAQNPTAALTVDTLQKQLTRTGGTAYTIRTFDATVESGLILPVSKLNALRREAMEALDNARREAMPSPAMGYDPAVKATLTARPERIAERQPSAAHNAVCYTARFRHAEQITDAAHEFFDILYLPLTHRLAGDKRGIVLPPAIFDRAYDRVRARLTAALTEGARHVLIGNVGHLSLVREAAEAARIKPDELTLHGDFRLNIANTTTASELLGEGLSDTGIADVILSPELTLPRLRDISDAHPGRTAAIVYGRLPLMLLEKCAIRELYGTQADHRAPNGQAGEACRLCARDAAVMVDRMGVTFPIVREFDHRNTVLNSRPLCMTDREDDLSRAHLTGRHMLFTVENATEIDTVIRATREGKPIGREVRRMMNK